MKKLLIAILILFGILLLPAGTATAQGGLLNNFKQQACEGVDLGSGNVDCSTGSASRINTILTTVINIFSLVVGVIAVIMLIIGGLKFITSQGDPASISSARSSIIYAVVGLVVVVFAQLIVRFVLTKASP